LRGVCSLLSEALRGLYAFDLGQIERRERYVPYAFGWTTSHIARELRHQYLLGYVPDQPDTRGWRSIRVEVAGRPGLRVRARDGYMLE
jgi:hypothetical protein